MLTIVACLCGIGCLGNETVFIIQSGSDQARAETEERVEHRAYTTESNQMK
jgi:hypothetical protein